MNINEHFKEVKSFINLEQQTDREIRTDLQEKTAKNILKRQDLY